MYKYVNVDVILDVYIDMIDVICFMKDFLFIP